MEITLEHTNSLFKSGYRVEQSENWKAYKPDLSPSMLAHDLFQHRLGERGTAWEETRATGATYWFHKEIKINSGVHRLSIRNGGWETMPELEDVKVSARIWNDLEKIDLLGHSIHKIGRLMQIGYNWAKARKKVATKEAYSKVREFDFYLMHSICRQNLRVNLTTGTIVRM
jgi:hypothetical protein